MDALKEHQLRTIFCTVLEVDDAAVTSARRIVTHRWDSLAQTAIIAAVESEFDVMLDLKDMERITSFEATKLLLEEKGV